VIDRLPHLGSPGAYIKQYLRTELLDLKAYIEMNSEEILEILNWKWELTHLLAKLNKK
jgi:xylulose-5-phosphate/fructose-6-phosphate phosphoketolase